VIVADATYAAPESVEEAVALLAADPTARVLGGGTWVVPELSTGASRPGTIVDLRCAGLAGVTQDAGAVRIGAMATYADLLASDAVPLLTRMAAGITGGWALRNQGTVGGSLAAARPHSEVPAVLTALGAEAVVRGPRGERRLPAVGLVRGATRTALAHDEVLTGLVIPAAPAGQQAGYRKLKRGSSSWPIATAAALVTLDGDGTCAAATLVLGGVAATPLFVDVAGDLVGHRPGTERLAAAAARVVVTDPWDDVLAPGAYRAAVAAPIARRALEDAFDRGAIGWR
jgi:CO/xanthine dehydrogenase FAD-binding subunit